MHLTKAAHRYADALYDSVPPETGTERFLADLRDVRASIAASRELWNFFVSPVIPQAKKRETLRVLFAGRLDAYTFTALEFLIEKKREALVLEIIDGVLNLDRAHRGIQQASTASAQTLDDGQRERITGMLERMTGKRIEPEFRVDPSLIGGLVVRVGDTVYDGSVSRQLQLLRVRLMTG